MGGSSRCAVSGCKNDRRYKSRLIIKDHVPELRFHFCPPKWRLLWSKLINRKAVTGNTRVCSNHFVLGKPIGIQPHPVMYMRGYAESHGFGDNGEIQKVLNSWSLDDESTYLTTRRGKVRRIDEDMNKNKRRTELKDEATSETPVSPESDDRINSDHHYTVPSVKLENASPSQTSTSHSPHKSLSSYSTSDLLEEHNYCLKSESACTCSSVCEKCQVKSEHVVQDRDMDSGIKEELLDEREEFGRTLSNETQLFPVLCDISNIKHSDELMRLHTGIENYSIFQWVFEEVQSKLPSIHYLKGEQSENVNACLSAADKKPGPQRKLSHENELLLTLMKLKLNLPEMFLAYLFNICTSDVSQIISTWLSLLAKELRPLLYWPTQGQIQLYYPDCFKKYKYVRAIIDCIEIPIQRPSLAKSNSQLYSRYKERPTAKVLVACTPPGTVSFVSRPAGECNSDEEIVKRSGIIDMLERGDVLLADRGFDIQEQLLDKGVSLVIPPFLKSEQLLSDGNDGSTEQVTDAQIHIERVIGRMKDFEIMKSELSLDIFDDVVVIVAALINLQPPIIPL